MIKRVAKNRMPMIVYQLITICCLSSNKNGILNKYTTAFVFNSTFKSGSIGVGSRRAGSSVGKVLMICSIHNYLCV